MYVRCDRLDDALELAKRECTKINLDLVNELGKSCQISGNVSEKRLNLTYMYKYLYMYIVHVNAS